MNKNNRQINIAHEALIILGVVAILMFICRLWPLLLLTISGIVIAAMCSLFKNSKRDEPIMQTVQTKEIEREPTEKDVFNMAYYLINKRITEIVTDEYPDARWVWEQPNTKRMIQNSEDVYICLNKAGGYARAKVCIKNLSVYSLDYQAKSTSNQDVNSELGNDVDYIPEPDDIISKPENYGLVAFQWVETNTLELNNRCNDAIGQGQEMLFIDSTELPVPESWADICIELKRVGLEGAVRTDNGINIYLTQ